MSFQGARGHHETGPLREAFSLGAWKGWIDEFNADGDDAEGFAFGRIDLADVGQLLLASGQRVDRVTDSLLNISSKSA